MLNATQNLFNGKTVRSTNYDTTRPLGLNRSTQEASIKTAIVLFSDPKSGSEEALGRAFNALAAAYDFQQHGEPVQIYFQGAGTRWPAELAKPDHPAHALFEAVKVSVVGVSCGCADVFGARESVAGSGFDLLTENSVPGTSGLPSLRRIISEGYTVLSF